MRSGNTPLTSGPKRHLVDLAQPDHAPVGGQLVAVRNLTMPGLPSDRSVIALGEVDEVTRVPARSPALLVPVKHSRSSRRPARPARALLSLLILAAGPAHRGDLAVRRERARRAVWRDPDYTCFVAIANVADRYDVIQRLGKGGMGDVWLANDTLLGRDVALKFVDERHLRETPSAGRILEDEARTAGKLLGLPQVVSVLDLLHAETALHRGPVLVMELINGCNLAEWISIHRPRLDETGRYYLGLYISLETVEAISSAHKMGILHRDIKPQNILCSEQGRVKVADFGLARVVEAITRTHTVWANHTPLYAAPEQWNEKKPDQATDVYQLCATIYHLLAGRACNEGSTLIELMRWHDKGAQVKPLQELVPNIDDAVAKTVHEGLSKASADRPGPWEMFDAISTAVMRPLRVKFDIGNHDEVGRKFLAKLLDLGDNGFITDDKRVPEYISYPNPMEALRMANAAVVQGGICTFEEKGGDPKSEH